MAYDAERDLIFYQKPAQSGFVVLKADDFAIVPPEDAHAPRRQATSCGCPVKEIVVKIKVYPPNPSARRRRDLCRPVGERSCAFPKIWYTPFQQLSP